MAKDKIHWPYFPKSARRTLFLEEVVRVFESAIPAITSLKHVGQVSNEVLAKVRPGLEVLGFAVEFSKSNVGKIKVPVLFGQNGKVEKSFEADAYHADQRVVLEVEAGRGVTNYQFLKDLFQACVMQDVDFAVIAVRKDYRGSDDFGKVVSFFETLYVSTKFNLPLKGILVIGY